MSSEASELGEPERSIKTRRTHTKSRGGCIECKRRKVKCNEEHPRCSGCIKRETECVWPDLRTPSKVPSVRQSTQGLCPEYLQESNHNGKRSLSPRGSPILSHMAGGQIAQPLVGVFYMNDMTLWHNAVMGKDTASIIGPYGSELVHEALKVDYLMHAILAISALHLAFTSTRPQDANCYREAVARHQELAHHALNSQGGIVAITPTNAAHRFAFSTLQVVISFAQSRLPENLFPPPRGPPQTDPIASWLQMLKGPATITALAYRHIADNPLGLIIKRGREAQAAMMNGQFSSVEDVSALNYIHQGLLSREDIKRETAPEDMQTYSSALHLLHVMFAAQSHATDPLSKRIPTSMWPVQISDDFIRLLGRNRIPALVIMAYYTILLKRVDDCWYMHGRGEKIFRAIERRVGPEWDSLMRYPKSFFEAPTMQHQQAMPYHPQLHSQ